MQRAILWNRVILTLALTLTASAKLATAAPATQPSTPPATQPSGPPVAVDLKDEEALKTAMGKMVMVDGVVSAAEWSSSGKVLRIKFEGADKSHFLAIIFEPQRREFDKAYSSDVAKALVGATVHVEGPLTPYRDQREIIIKAESQLKIVKPAVAGATAKN